jgi:lipopolysaccharide export LptBFGC system permease protein LptF
MERDGSQFGMTLEPKPSAAEIQSIIDAANAAMAVGRDGDSQIDLGHWMYIKERIMNGGNLKKLRRDIEFMIRKKEERDQAMTTQNIMAQKEQDAKTAQIVAQEKQKEALMKHEMEMELEDKKTQNQLLIDKNESDLDLKNKIAEMALETDKEDKRA